jgi:hypothetical protein
MTNWRVAEQRAAELREHLKRGTLRTMKSASTERCSICDREVRAGESHGTFSGKTGRTTACSTCMDVHRLVLRTDHRPMD